jgi:hypothetical protein
VPEACLATPGLPKEKDKREIGKMTKLLCLHGKRDAAIGKTQFLLTSKTTLGGKLLFTSNNDSSETTQCISDWIFKHELGKT